MSTLGRSSKKMPSRYESWGSVVGLSGGLGIDDGRDFEADELFEEVVHRGAGDVRTGICRRAVELGRGCGSVSEETTARFGGFLQPNFMNVTLSEEEEADLSRGAFRLGCSSESLQFSWSAALQSGDDLPAASHLGGHELPDALEEECRAVFGEWGIAARRPSVDVEPALLQHGLLVGDASAGSRASTSGPTSAAPEAVPLPPTRPEGLQVRAPFRRRAHLPRDAADGVGEQHLVDKPHIDSAAAEDCTAASEQYPEDATPLMSGAVGPALLRRKRA